MPGVSDQEYLLASQYHGGSNLEARIALHARFSVNSYGWFPWLFDHLQLENGARILDMLSTWKTAARCWRRCSPRWPCIATTTRCG